MVGCVMVCMWYVGVRVFVGQYFGKIDTQTPYPSPYIILTKDG